MNNGFRWTKPKLEAAWLYAKGELPNNDICQQTKIPERTFYRMVQTPEFELQVDLNLVKIEHAIWANDIRIRNIVAGKLVERLNLPGQAFPLTELTRIYLGTRKKEQEESGGVSPVTIILGDKVEEL